MKQLGIIGGLGPESTVDYYQTLIALYRERQPDGSYPPILINSIDMRRAVKALEASDLKALTDYLLTELEKLQRAGADFAIVSANTPHIVFEELEQQSPLPLISIVTAAREAAKTRGLKRVGLFATTFTVQAGFYSTVFARQGIEIVAPTPAEQDYIHEKYMGELVHGIFLPETRAGLLGIVDRLAHEARIQGVILGGTELPLILRAEAHNGIPLLNTTRIHAQAAIERMFS
jgi:aspartate racemase